MAKTSHADFQAKLAAKMADIKARGFEFDPVTGEQVADLSNKDAYLQMLKDKYGAKDRAIRAITRKMMGDNHKMAGIRLMCNRVLITEAVRLLWREVASPAEAYFLVGPPGTGKTYASVGFAAEITPADGRCEFVKAYKMADYIHRREHKKLDRLEHAAVVVIDDLGTEPNYFKGDDLNAYFNYLFDLRSSYKGYCTIITSNLLPEEAKAQYTERFYSRFKGVGKVIICQGPDLRTTNATT